MIHKTTINALGKGRLSSKAPIEAFCQAYSIFIDLTLSANLLKEVESQFSVHEPGTVLEIIKAFINTVYGRQTLQEYKEHSHTHTA